LKVYSNSVDISNYITSISDIPITAVNKDYSLYIPSLNITISEMITTEPKEGDLIDVQIEDTTHKTFYKGYISNVDYDDIKCIYKCKIFNLLAKLKDKFITYQNLNDKIAAGRDYVSGAYTPTDWDFSSGNKWVNCIYLVKCLIEDGTGETVDTSRLETIVDATYSNNIFKYKFLIPMVWAMGQKKAMSVAAIDAHPEYAANCVKYFDLADVLFNIFKIKITYEENKYYLTHISDKSTTAPSDNTIYKKSKKTILNSNNLGWVIDYALPDNTLAISYEGGPTNSQPLITDTYRIQGGWYLSRENISVPTNFMILVEHALVTTDVWNYGYHSSYYPNFICTYKSYCDYAITKYTTLKSVEPKYYTNTFNIKKEESRIEILEFLHFQLSYCSLVPSSTGVPIDLVISMTFTTPPKSFNNVSLTNEDTTTDIPLTITKVDDTHYTAVPISGDLQESTNYAFLIEKRIGITNVYGRGIEDSFYAYFTTEHT